VRQAPPSRSIQLWPLRMFLRAGFEPYRETKRNIMVGKTL
jgi:hypothetical protein